MVLTTYALEPTFIYNNAVLVALVDGLSGNIASTVIESTRNLFVVMTCTSKPTHIGHVVRIKLPITMLHMISQLPMPVAIRGAVNFDSTVKTKRSIHTLEVLVDQCHTKVRQSVRRPRKQLKAAEA